MVANIATNAAGEYAAVYVGKPAWHNLGKVVTDAMTPQEALDAAGTGYIVEGAPLFAIINDEAVEVQDRVANYRTDTGAILGIVSTEYPIIQNITPMQILMAIAQTGQAGIVSHAALGKGERLFAVLDLKRLTDLRVPGDPSRIDAFMVAQWWHDGTGALSFGPSAVRVDCQNMANAQMAYAEGKGLLVRIPHVGNLDAKIEEARRVLGFAEQRVADFVDMLGVLATIKIPQPEEAWLGGWLEKVVPIPPEMERPLARRATREAITRLYFESETLIGVPHTAYRALQAVTEYADHYRPVRVSDRELVPARRFTSSVDGPAARTKADALRLLREEFEVK
jgi:phage/plasmid-like protein (TIGR03299 family)